MDKTKPKEDWDGFNEYPFGNIWLSNVWNEESRVIMNANKVSVTDGSYKINLIN